MRLFWIIVYIIFWLVIWVQMFLLLFFFFSLIVADYRDRFERFLKWLGWLIWYVYFLPLGKYGFPGWQNWVYFYRHHEFTGDSFMQWFCEPTPWLAFMLFYTLLCFFYEWLLKFRFDYFLFYLPLFIAFIILTV